MTPRWRPADADHAELELAPSDLLDDRVRVGHGQRDVNQRVEAWNSPSTTGNTLPPGPGRGTDLEPALELALGLLAEFREQLLLEREQPLRSAVEPQARLGRLDPAAGAVEEPLADALLERADLEADRRLRHPELVGGL